MATIVAEQEGSTSAAASSDVDIDGSKTLNSSVALDEELVKTIMRNMPMDWNESNGERRARAEALAMEQLGDGTTGGGAEAATGAGTSAGGGAAAQPPEDDDGDHAGPHLTATLVVTSMLRRRGFDVSMISPLSEAAWELRRLVESALGEEHCGMIQLPERRTLVLWTRQGMARRCEEAHRLLGLRSTGAQQLTAYRLSRVGHCEQCNMIALGFCGCDMQTCEPSEQPEILPVGEAVDVSE